MNDIAKNEKGLSVDSTIDNIFESLDTSFKEYIAAKKAFNNVFKDRFFDVVKEAFDRFPTLQAISWCQYAPYFNDGEPCEFSVHDPEFAWADPNDAKAIDRINEIIEDGDPCQMLYELDTRPYDQRRKFKDRVEGKFEDMFADYICNIDMEDAIREVFGEDAYIVCTRDGIISGDYGDMHD